MTHWRLALADASPAWKVLLSKSGRNSLWWPKSCLSDCDAIADIRRAFSSDQNPSLTLA